MTENPQQPYGAPGQQQPYGNPAFEGQDQQAAGQPGSKYGTAAYDSGAVGQAMPEPKKWGLLKTLTLTSLAVYVLSSVLGVLTAANEELLDATMDSQAEAMGVPREQLEAGADIGAAIGIGFAIVLAVIAVILYVVVYVGLKKVKNWGRILGTVLAALGVLFTAYGLTGMGLMMDIMPAMAIASLVITVVFLIVNIIWIVVAFSKENNAYVASRRV